MRKQSITCGKRYCYEWEAMKLSKRIGITILLLGVLLAWFHQFQLVGYTQIHWDEFYFLSKIHAHQDDRWFHAIQSIYVHWLGWVTQMGSNEVDQILYGRLFTVIFLVGIMVVCLYGCVHRLTRSPVASLAAVFIALAHPFVAFQSFRFRADPMIGTGFLVAATLLISYPWSFSAIIFMA